MGQVIHQNDRLVKPYQDHKKNVDKNIFCCHGNHKNGRFYLFLSIFKLPNQGFGAGAPDMDHVIQQNDYLVKPYQDNKRNIVKKHFCHHGNHKTGRFRLFLSIFGSENTKKNRPNRPVLGLWGRGRPTCVM